MAKDIYHDIVQEALIKDGWTITNDPLVLLSKEEGGLETDLGAEKLITAEKDKKRIGVEVKSFLQPSLMHEAHRALGQYNFYTSALLMKQDERQMFLAMPIEALNFLNEKEIFRRTMRMFKVRLLIFDPETITIESWIEE